MPRFRTVLFVLQWALVGLGATFLILLLERHDATDRETTVDPLVADPLFREFFDIPRFHADEPGKSALGRGVIIDGHGYVLTDYHVVAGAHSIRVALSDGRGDTADRWG